MHGNAMGGMQMGDANDISPNANTVPGFPQDAYMEGPMMNMDKAVDKPQNYGLPPGWTEEMQGMMTIIRVLPPDQYRDMMSRIERRWRTGGQMKSRVPAIAILLPGIAFAFAGSCLGQMEMNDAGHMQHDMPGMQMPADQASTTVAGSRSLERGNAAASVTSERSGGAGDAK